MVSPLDAPAIAIAHCKPFSGTPCSRSNRWSASVNVGTPAISTSWTFAIRGRPDAAVAANLRTHSLDASINSHGRQSDATEPITTHRFPLRRWQR
jgi:hypothetical protein